LNPPCLPTEREQPPQAVHHWLGRHRYTVERSLAWLASDRRLQVRCERRADILLGFMHLACALLCLKQLNQPKL
jgi:transposase